MTDWEIKNMIETRPTEAFNYIKELEEKLGMRKVYKVDTAAKPTYIIPPIWEETT